MPRMYAGWTNVEPLSYYCSDAQTSDFLRVWNEWRHVCQSKVAVLEAEDSRLSQICKVLSGDANALAELK